MGSKPQLCNLITETEYDVNVDNMGEVPMLCTAGKRFFAANLSEAASVSSRLMPPLRWVVIGTAYVAAASAALAALAAPA